MLLDVELDICIAVVDYVEDLFVASKHMIAVAMEIMAMPSMPPQPPESSVSYCNLLTSRYTDFRTAVVT